jgi:hypothetical protein
MELRVRHQTNLHDSNSSSTNQISQLTHCSINGTEPVFLLSLLIPPAILTKILRSKKLQTEETSRNKHDFKGGLARKANYLTH